LNHLHWHDLVTATWLGFVGHFTPVARYFHAHPGAEEPHEHPEHWRIEEKLQERELEETKAG